MRSMTELVNERSRKYGDKFSTKSLEAKFIPHFQSGNRIKVETMGQVITGTVGVTTGWVPCFLLMRTTRSLGSIYTLGPNDRILAVQYGRKKPYTPVME